MQGLHGATVLYQKQPLTKFIASIRIVETKFGHLVGFGLWRMDWDVHYFKAHTKGL